MTTVGVIGLGYVGLAARCRLRRRRAARSSRWTSTRARSRPCRPGESYIEDVSSDDAGTRCSSGCIATTRYADLAAGATRCSICVPTPLTRNREPDLGPLIESARALAEVLQADQLVVLESTTYPGTTRERMAPLLEESGLAAGRDFHLAFSPERVDPGRTDFTLRNTPKVARRARPTACAERAEALYGLVCDRCVRVSSPEAAELTKLLENIFRSVNIALVNELAMLTDRMGIDIWEVVDAAATKPYGFMRFEPGAGHGRALPARRSLLSELACARVRHGDRVHRAGRQGQPADALPLRGQGPARAQRPRPVGQGRAHRGDRRQLQARRRRHARVARAEDHRAAAQSSARRCSTTTRTCPSLAEFGSAQHAARAGARRRGSGADRDRPS